MDAPLQYRTFIAIPLKPGHGTLDAVLELKRLLEGERISWVDPGNYHITLRFIGDVAISSIDAISDAMEAHVTLPPKVILQFSGAGLFGPRRRPKVIYLGFSDDSLLKAMHREVERALESCGIPPVENSFRAHLTLGRVRAVRDLKGLHEKVASMKGRFGQEIEADRLVFFRSELRKEGPLYTPLWSGFFRD